MGTASVRQRGVLGTGAAPLPGAGSPAPVRGESGALAAGERPGAVLRNPASKAGW